MSILNSVCLSILSVLTVSDVYAQASTPVHQTTGSLASFLPMMLVFIVGAYFLMIRPQNKRIKAHRKLIAELAKGDEVVTAGGLVGRVSKISDDLIALTVAENVDVNLQKSAITNVLPKGTLKTV